MLTIADTYTKLKRLLDRSLRVTAESGDSELQKVLIPKIIALKDLVTERERSGRESVTVKE